MKVVKRVGGKPERQQKCLKMMFNCIKAGQEKGRRIKYRKEVPEERQ